MTAFRARFGAVDFVVAKGIRDVDRLPDAAREAPVAARPAPDPHAGLLRDLRAWLGLAPRPRSSGGKQRLGRISTAGNRRLRRFLSLGAMARVGVRLRGRPGSDRLRSMLRRKPAKVAAVAFAYRMVRIVRALIRTGETYRPAAN